MKNNKQNSFGQFLCDFAIGGIWGLIFGCALLGLLLMAIGDRQRGCPCEPCECAPECPCEECPCEACPSVIVPPREIQIPVPQGET